MSGDCWPIEMETPQDRLAIELARLEPREIVCGARNFAEGDLIVAALPGMLAPPPSGWT